MGEEVEFDPGVITDPGWQPEAWPAEGTLGIAFQPLATLHGMGLHGYEALVRPSERFATPGEFFSAARAEGTQVEMQLRCYRRAIDEFTRLRLPGKLFVNLGAEALLSEGELIRSLVHHVFASGMAPSQVVIELTERDEITDFANLIRVLADLRERGFGIALDDFGEGTSGLRLWLEVKPDYVKIDKFFVDGMQTSTAKFEALRCLAALAGRLNTQLIAEGVESETQLMLVRDLGLPIVQGYIVAPPSLAPDTRVSGTRAAALLRAPAAQVVSSVQRGDQRLSTIAGMLLPAPSLSASASVRELDALFRKYPQLHAVAIVDRGVPAGLVGRARFMERCAQPENRQQLATQPCTVVMDPRPLVLDASLPIESLSHVLSAQDQRYLADGIIVVSDNCYIGLASGQALISALSALRIEAARHANPLTLLPGNIPITDHIEQLIAANTRFVACYCDLDHFKPFNDQYGYWRGDEMIKLAARHVTRRTDPRVDFVGHVGGDDFLVLFRSADWHVRSTTIRRDFAIDAAQLYDAAERQRGSMQGEDRHGHMRSFPLVTMSIGAVEVGAETLRSAEQVASAAAAAKRLAKRSPSGIHLLSTLR
jgi:diguanylate cyclase (GGDEF)-like protein